MDEDRNLRSRLVVGAKRDGRREYDPQAREELVQLCMKPGVSIARTAMEFGLNPNVLRGWITRHQKAHAAVSSGESEFERSNEQQMPCVDNFFPEQSVNLEAGLSRETVDAGRIIGFLSRIKRPLARD